MDIFLQEHVPEKALRKMPGSYFPSNFKLFDKVFENRYLKVFNFQLSTFNFQLSTLVFNSDFFFFTKARQERFIVYCCVHVTSISNI